eukprot:6695911-Prymnesium_polylepis.1
MASVTIWTSLLELSDDDRSGALLCCVSALVANAVEACQAHAAAHGSQTGDERRVDVSVHSADGGAPGFLHIRVADDGAGVNWDRLGDALEFNVQPDSDAAQAPPCVGLKAVLLWSAHPDGESGLHFQSTSREAREVTELRLWLESPQLEVGYEPRVWPKPDDVQPYGGTVARVSLIGPPDEAEATAALRGLIESVRGLCVDAPFRLTYALPRGVCGDLIVGATPLTRIL